MPRITDFCSCIYVFGCRISLVGLCDSDFRITPVDDITVGITCAAFCFHTAHISFSSSWYLSVIVLAKLCVFGTTLSIKKVFFVFLFIKFMSGRLKVIIIIIIIIIIIAHLCCMIFVLITLLIFVYICMCCLLFSTALLTRRLNAQTEFN